jgi:Holliday junction resolvasome RuvABC ATP-dependent DNA helicase subunit
MGYDYYVPSHGEVLSEPGDTLDANIRILKDTILYISEICSMPLDREEIVANIVERFGIKQNITQYYLTVSTVSAFLSHMSNEGMLATLFENNKLKFMRKS